MSNKRKAFDEIATPSPKRNRIELIYHWNKRKKYLKMQQRSQVQLNQLSLNISQKGLKQQNQLVKQRSVIY